VTGTETPYHVVQHTERLRNNVFTVVTDVVAMPGGGTAVRDYIVHVGAVAVVALDDQGRVALIWQYRAALGRYLWELPAGLVDVPGEPLADAAVRELAEEADLLAGRVDLLVDVHTSPGSSTEKIRIFLARDLSPVPDDVRHERTHEEADLVVRWFDLDQAVVMGLGSEITNAACLAGVFAAAHARDHDWATLRPASAAT
jgi:8-oxo-dGTP pyrophosphatase MutT (NUDIX family)